MFTSTLWNQGWPQLQWGTVIGASLAAAVMDVCWRRIPNLLTGPMLVAGLAWAAWQAGWAGLADSFLACVLLAAPYVLLFVFAGGGAGDAKMMGAVGAWLGVLNGLAALAGVAVCAAILAGAWSVAKKRFAETMTNLMLLFAGAARRITRSKQGSTVPQATELSRLTMPYGLAILAGVTIAAAGVWIWRG